MEETEDKKTKIDVSDARDFVDNKLSKVRTALPYFVIFFVVLIIFLLLLTTFFGYKLSILENL